jgi:hypothetical protein
MRTIVAIDPGVSGGIAIRDAGGLIQLFPMPQKLTEIAGLLRFNKVADADLWIEEVPKFTGRNIPSSSAAVLFQNFGRIEGLAVALGYSLHRVAPVTWQNPLGLGGKKSCASPAEWKRKLKAKAEELYPTLEPTLKTADALLILHYAQGGGR